MYIVSQNEAKETNRSHTYNECFILFIKNGLKKVPEIYHQNAINHSKMKTTIYLCICQNIENVKEKKMLTRKEREKNQRYLTQMNI